MDYKSVSMYLVTLIDLSEDTALNSTFDLQNTKHASDFESHCFLLQLCIYAKLDFQQ